MDPNVLFSGLRFDQKKFSAEVQRFKRKPGELSVGEKEDRSKLGVSDENQSNNGDRPEIKTPDAKSSNGRPSKKRKGAVSSEAASAFNIFRAPGSLVSEVASVSGQDSVQEEDTSARLAEAISVLRKRCRLHVSGQNIPQPLTSFEDLKSQTGYRCKKYIRNNITSSGYTEPTPIQRQAVPTLLARRECLACAQTGSGKTLSFILPILMNLKKHSEDGIRAVVLCPIRELATQTAREFRKMTKGSKIRVRALTRSMCLDPNIKDLPIDVLVSTPLRLEKLLKHKKLSLDKVEYLVMDESDKLFEMGFVKQIDTIVEACSSPRVVRALFSATLPDSVEELARTIMVDPVRITVGEKNSAASTVDQRLVYVGSEDGKFLALKQLFRESLKPPILLFVESKEKAKELHRDLAIDGVSVDSIHAGRSQYQRDAAVEKFREGKTWILIATDLMARGMDFKGVNCVINYDFPKTIATYIHRIGRTGRAGRRGEAITFHTEKDRTLLRSIANVIKSSGGEVPNWMINLPRNMKKIFNRRTSSRKSKEDGHMED
ncbi:hypothetical protein AXG93_40s1050 [Marchantia polymorpha subsp. ruderalis]|uniref:RNA helicase n=3 Tax=Marchantia polymorpha TaxID=3197 RepID=A0A176WBM6_MARPO|nr:hypothetical protein AXG93_40s1050 [Marchantia polymorpha subsp. ruderalis]